MSPEELDEARAKEAQRLWESGQEAGSSSWVVAARLARENWTPPEPVGPDILAFREWAVDQYSSKEVKAAFLAGERDNDFSVKAYLAGARMAREQERERAKVLLECLDNDNVRQFSGWVDSQRAARALAKYRGEA